MKGVITLPKRKIKKEYNIQEKLDYLGLDLDNIPEILKDVQPLEFRVPKIYNEKQYRQYRFVPINKIQILLSPTNRSDDLNQKYKKSKYLVDYLDSENEENLERYTKFLQMLRQVDVNEIKQIEEEQRKLNERIPFKVKFEGNYLWQIYYSENTDMYFMLVPTEDVDYSTLFYLIKKQIENKPDEKIFVPIRNADYSKKFLKKSEFEDISNYLWLFTKDWPFIYEVYDENDEMSIIIIGETEIYEKIKSIYRIKLRNLKEARKFYKLLKAMFILQTELPNYYTFGTNISKIGRLEFYHEDKVIKYENMPEWINEQCKIGIPKCETTDELIEENLKKLENLKQIAAEQEIEYLSKEKQISTFLECKKTFFGKFKYYFKYSKSKNNKRKKDIEKEEAQNVEINKKQYTKQFEEKENYTIEEMIEIYKKLEEKETNLKNIVMDINAIKLKNKNTKKKIENATAFIREIDNHKKSIFEFWKYSNKDEVSALTEGETEEVNISKKITKVFDYKEDIEEFGKMMDKIQRKALTKEETDSLYLTTTNVLEILNLVKRHEALKKDIDQSLRGLKKEAENKEIFLENEEFNIFGGLSNDTTKISRIADKKHRETQKDKFNILKINKNMKSLSYKLELEEKLENIKNAIEKVVVSEDLPVYKATKNEKMIPNNINLFNINPENEMKEILNLDENKAKLYKINLVRGVNAISYTNCIFYDNQNKTLPIGQDLSTKILIDLTKMQLKLKSKTIFKILEFEDEKDDFSNIRIKNIMVIEYDAEILN